MSYRREKIKLKNGTVVKENEWLIHWKKSHEQEVNEIRERIKERVNNEPFGKKTKVAIEELVDREILEPVWEGPESHPDGSYLSYMQPWQQDQIIDEQDEVEEEEERIAESYDNLHELLNNLKNGEIIKMYFGIGYERRMSEREIAQKTGFVASYVHKAIHMGLKIIRNNLKK